MNRYSYRFLFFLTLPLLISVPICSQTLLLKDYLDQVRQNQTGFKAALLSQQSSEYRQKEKDLLTAPQFFAKTSVLTDQKQSLNSYIIGNNSQYINSTVGVSFQTDSGWQGKVHYDLLYSTYPNANPTYVPKSFYEGSPILELSKSLIRNANGEEVKAQQSLSEASLQSQFFVGSYKMKQLLSLAEQTYWQLALAIETVQLREASVQHAVSMKEWTKRREALSLTDHSDVLQAEASLKFKRLELLSAMNDKRIAIRNFNAQRGINSETLSETIASFDEINSTTMTIVPKRFYKDDLQALSYTQKATEMSAFLAQQKLIPSLDLFGSLALNTRQSDLENALLNAASIDHPTSLIGIQYTLSLDTAAQESVKKGLELEVAYGKSVYEQKKFDQNQECKLLLQKLEDAQKRLKLALEIEEAQKEKWSYESQKQTKGRSTINQVINFEQDYVSAQLSTVRTKAEMMQIVAQLKEF